MLGWVVRHLQFSCFTEISQGKIVAMVMNSVPNGYTTLQGELKTGGRPLPQANLNIRHRAGASLPATSADFSSKFPCGAFAEVFSTAWMFSTLEGETLVSVYHF